MHTANEQLPLSQIATPASQEDLAGIVARCYEDSTPLFPLGGCTALGYGVAATDSGEGLSLAALNRVVDYPVRDMTITVEAGITIDQLTETLAAGGQRLPIDVPLSDRATLGGVIATNTSGARRFGSGTIRDYVIGISAVDGRGVPFKGGGRVVKNVAGYDFCKLLTGSMGSLAVITQVTLKVRPIPQAAAFVVCPLEDGNQARSLLAMLTTTKTTASAVEILQGPAWNDDPALNAVEPGKAGRLAIGLEGTNVEVAWLMEQLESEWRGLGVRSMQRGASDEDAGLWSRLAEFPAREGSALVVKCNCLPSKTIDLIEKLNGIDPQVDIQSHAGNGIIVARFPAANGSASMKDLVAQRIRPAVADVQGSVVVLGGDAAKDLPRETVWGRENTSWMLMRSVKNQFDPKNILNRGRFVF